MSTFCPAEALKTASDVEQKLIYPILTREDGLGFDPAEVRTKEYLPPVEIDKGAGKKVGYFADYGIYLASLPVLVAEAKSPDESVDEGFREAQLYAHELNKRFPPGMNPVHYVVASNGRELILGPWDSDALLRIPFEELIPTATGFLNFRRLCTRSALMGRALSIRRQLLGLLRYRPLTMLGGHAVQNRELPPNSFASELIPVLRRFFGPDAHDNLEVLRRGYVASEQTTRYEKTLESLLRDNLGRIRMPEQVEIKTTRHAAPEFEKGLQTALEERNSGSQILVIGSVGAGKSMFLERYWSFLRGEEITARTKWAVLDFNDAPAELHEVERWTCRAFLEDFRRRNDLGNTLDRETLNHYFAPEISNRARGPYAQLVDSQPEEYERRIADDLARWVEDPEMLTQGMVRYYEGDEGIQVVVVFDNVDRRDREQQLRIFQAAQWFRARFKCFIIVSLRDETYDRYRGEPPLDAVYPLLVFRVTPPRFVDVAKKRVELALEHLARSVTGIQSYKLPSGITVRYPASRLGEFLMAVYLVLFQPQRLSRSMLEAMAGRNVRHALQMFTDILISGHLTTDRLFTTTVGKTRIRLPEWLVIRILMRTKYQNFSSDHGYVLNIFEIDPDSPSTTNLLLLECLDFLAARRKVRGELGIEGYVWVRKVVEHIARSGYRIEDALWALERLLTRSLIVAEHMRPRGIHLDNYVKIRASGFFHAKVLVTRVEYLSAAATDCFYRDKRVAEKIIASLSKDRNDSSRLGKLERALILRDYLEAEAKTLCSLTGCSPKALEIVRGAYDVMIRFEGRREGERGLEVPRGAFTQGPLKLTES